MDSHAPDSGDSVIHKEKNQKKTEVNRTIVNSLIDNSTIVKGSTAVNSISEQLLEQQNRYKSIAQKKLIDADRNSKLLRNSEIDDCLQGWIMSGLASDAFAPWIAKCCHTLTLEKVNRLANSARSGKTPDRLFASLLKGAMQVHYRRQFYQTEQGSATD